LTELKLYRDILEDRTLGLEIKPAEFVNIIQPHNDVFSVSVGLVFNFDQDREGFLEFHKVQSELHSRGGYISNIRILVPFLTDMRTDYRFMKYEFEECKDIRFEPAVSYFQTPFQQDIKYIMKFKAILALMGNKMPVRLIRSSGNVYQFEGN